MPDLWLPGAERHPTNNGGTMDGTGGARATWHYTGDRNATASNPQDHVPFENVLGYFTGSGAGYAPHLLVDPFTGQIAQFIPGNESSRSLVNLTGGVETNRKGDANIQIEWVFFPYCRFDGVVYPTLADTPFKGLDRVMSYLRDWGVPDLWPMGVPNGTSQRNSSVWNAVPGHYGHSQVPENDHTDPGPVGDVFGARIPIPTPVPPARRTRPLALHAIGNPIMTTTPPAPVAAKPEGLILVHVDSAQFNGNEVFGIWPTGFVRQILEPELRAWGSPAADVWVQSGDDATANALRAYDKALRA